MTANQLLQTPTLIKPLRTYDIIFNSSNLRTLTTVYGSYFVFAYNTIHDIIIIHARNVKMKMVSNHKLISAKSGDSWPESSTYSKQSTVAVRKDLLNIALSLRYLNVLPTQTNVVLIFLYNSSSDLSPIMY